MPVHEPCFSHTTRFRSPSIEVKSLDCGSPADSVGFEHEYEASRISLVRSGMFGRIVRGTSLLADSTQVLFVNRGDIHRFVHPVAGGDACTVLEPSAVTLTELHARFSASATRFPVDQACTTRSVTRLHGSLLRALGRRSTAGDLAIEELALQVCGEVVAAARRDRPVTTSLSAAARKKQRQIVERVRLELYAQLRHPPNLTELARMADCSAFHLSRMFTAHVGMPMRSYVVRVRTAEAARRVLDGADDFAALALELGFYDHSHFTNTFAAVWGAAPSTLRESPSVRARVREQLLPNTARSRRRTL